MSEEQDRGHGLLYLNGHGCAFGIRLARRFDLYKDDLKEELKEDYKTRMDNLEKRLNQLILVGLGVMVSLTTASLTIWIAFVQ